MANWATVFFDTVSAGYSRVGGGISVMTDAREVIADVIETMDGMMLPSAWADAIISALEQAGYVVVRFEEGVGWTDGACIWGAVGVYDQSGNGNHMFDANRLPPKK